MVGCSMNMITVAPPRTVPQGVHSSSDNVQFGYLNIQNKIPPKYPKNAHTLSAGNFISQEGWVIVGFKIDTYGVPIDVQVVDSSPKKTFDKAAMKAIKQWRYNPIEMIALNLHDLELQQLFLFIMDEQHDQNVIRFYFWN